MDPFVRSLSQTIFPDVYRACSVDEKLELFYNKLKASCRLIPSTTITMSTKEKPRMTTKLKSLINARWYAFRMKDFGMYNHYKLKIKKKISKANMSWAERCSDFHFHDKRGKLCTKLEAQNTRGTCPASSPYSTVPRSAAIPSTSNLNLSSHMANSRPLGSLTT